MAVTLVQSAALSSDMLAKGVMEIFVQESPILDRIPQMQIEGNAYRYTLEASLPGVAFRGVNQAYSESTGTFNQLTEGLVILGGDADVDQFIQKTRSNLHDQRAEQTKLKVKAASRKYSETFFNGDVAVDPLGFDGLRKRLAGAQVFDPAPNGIPIVGNGTTDPHAFFDALDELIARVPGIDGSNGALYAPRSIAAKIKAAGRRIGGVEMVREDLTGKRVVQYNGIPVLDPGDTAAGAAILGQAETLGTSSDTASIYAVRYGSSEGDQAVTGLTNGGVQVYDLGELQEKPAVRTRIEFYTGVALFGGKAAARMRGVRNA